MLQLKSQVCDGFKVNKKLYRNRITDNQIQSLEYIESVIACQGTEFLSDPDYWISQWEQITGEIIPPCFTKDLPTEITGTAARLSRKSPVLYVTRFLPTVNQKGEEISYPSDRQVFDFKRTYILDDSLLSALTVS